MQLQKTSAWRILFIFKAPLHCANHFFLINNIRKLFWHSSLNEPQRKNFVLIIIQLSEVDIQPSSELFELLIQMSSLFIHVTNFKITTSIQNSTSITLSLRITLSLPKKLSVQLPRGRKFNYMCFFPIQFGNEDLVYHIIWPLMKHNLRFRMQGP